MSYAGFLESLFESGCVRVAFPLPLSATGVDAGNAVLCAFEQRWRCELPAGIPPYEPTSAGWAGTQLFRACQLLVFRDLGEAEVHELLASSNAPNPKCPTAVYNVDLTFRFLPDLFKLANAHSANDPLVGHLRSWARTWPLSSVGIPDPAPWEAESFREYGGLLAMYVDRIIAADDTSRLRQPQVAEAVRAALGGRSEPARRIHDVLTLDTAGTR